MGASGGRNGGAVARSGIAMLKEGESATRQVMGRVTDFLCSHHLAPSPGNFALAFDIVTMPQGTLAKAVARLTDDGVRLTQADLERLGGGSVGEQDAARQLAAGQALIARTTEQVEGFEAMVREIRDETGQFGDDLAANAAALIGPPAMPIEKVVNIAGAMVDRVRVAERRLQAATDEASELRLKLREARDNARRDPLTGLPNRRAFEESVVAARAANEAICIAVCDIDHFKTFNDTFGHLVGDRVLKAIAEVLADHCAGHLVARFGGEEFAVLFSGVALDDAITLLDQARLTVAGKRYRMRETGEPLGDISFSAGVTAATPDEAFAVVFERADRLLYAAKADGRNCIKAA